MVLITGASAGLGTELARELVRQKKAGALVLTARRGDRLDELASELKASRPGPADLDGRRRPRRSRDARATGRRDDCADSGGSTCSSTTRAWACRPCSKTPSPSNSLASSPST